MYMYIYVQMSVRYVANPLLYIVPFFVRIVFVCRAFAYRMKMWARPDNSIRYAICNNVNARVAYDGIQFGQGEQELQTTF